MNRENRCGGSLRPAVGPWVTWPTNGRIMSGHCSVCGRGLRVFGKDRHIGAHIPDRPDREGVA